MLSMRIDATAGANDVDILRQLNLHYVRAAELSDVRWYAENLAEDFLNSHADGTLVDRAAFLRQIAPACPLSNFDVEDVRIRILGETALVHGRTTYVKPDGRAGAGRYTDVWVRQGGRWVCVSGDVTRG